MSQPLEELIEVFPLIREDPEKYFMGLFNRASLRYDGDDRSLLLAQLVPRDLVSRLPEDLVISVDFDRKFTVPVWVPLLTSLIAFLGMLGAYLFSWRRGGKSE